MWLCYTLKKNERERERKVNQAEGSSIWVAEEMMASEFQHPSTGPGSKTFLLCCVLSPASFPGLWANKLLLLHEQVWVGCCHS